LTEFEFGDSRARIVGGLLGHWAIWTRSAVALVNCIKQQSGSISRELLTTAAQITDMNSAVFDAQNQFRGCIPGINEVLRRQGLLEGRLCLDPLEDLSPGQSLDIDRILAAYPHLHQDDDDFIRQHLHEWLR
jgi:dihydrodipicolinate synthase/N-acetylneuraminate lyase